ncbi:FkbM family methyltransferase [Neomoorella thermoacetica]|uniref:FkbM family methyltransferase n=1 Tax=Neomoorella thermoacetica TaxID=1525 RepID=UPI0008FA557B|nr:FkbM family methyltransferase [Moorella thermoacetica]OIQ10517.1 2-O-methyltransferase NoeI [Moorella thermoacetica]
MSFLSIDEHFLETKPCRYGLMSYFKTDLVIGRSLSQYGEWAQTEIDFLLGFLDSGDTVIDAGAFIGTHTIAFARKVGPNGKIYAFEPHPVTFEILKRNVSQNAITNVFLFNVALSDMRGTNLVKGNDFFASDNPGMFSIRSILNETLSFDKTLSIETMVLDEISFDKCDLIKLDIEGMEFNALNGARKTLQRFRPLVFAECLSVDNGWKIVEMMKTEGFRSFLHNEASYNPRNYRNNHQNFFGDAREANLFFIPEEKVSTLERCPKHLKSLIPINSIDDLVLGLLKKPQYKYEVLTKTAAAKVIGTDFWANETEVKRFTVEKQGLTKKVTELEGNLRELNNQLDSKVQEIIELRKQLATSYKMLTEKEQAMHSLKTQVKEKEQALTALEIELTKYRTELERKSYEISNLQTEMLEMRNSLGWLIIERYRNLVDRLFPAGTRRRHMFELGQRALKTLITSKGR